MIPRKVGLVAASMSWFYQRGQDEKVGPITQDEICDLFRRGVLSLETLVRSDAFKQWTPAKSIAGLRALVAPPIPSASVPVAQVVSAPPPIPAQCEATASPFFSSPAIQPLDYATPTETDGPVGFGGWLILPVLGMALNPLRILAQTVLLWFAADSAAVKALPGDPVGLMHVLSIASGILLIYQLYTSYVFFAKKRCAPNAVIGLFVFNILVTFFALVARTHFMPTAAAPPGSDAGTMVAPVIMALVWGSYFRKSVRVKNTFVN